MKISVKDLTIMAFYLALFVVLDILANQLPFSMPYGGTIGLSSIALLLASYHLSVKKAVIVGLASVLMQFITGKMYIVHPAQFFLDYLLAFPIYGLAVIMPSYWGVVVSNFLRFVFHFISGFIFFKQYAGPEGAIVYSLLYNGGYMLPTLLLGIIVVPLLAKEMKINKE